MITETDVANKILQCCGASRIRSNSTLWLEDTQNASEVRIGYDMIRRSELRRNVWRFSVRTEVLRPMTATTYVMIFPEWDATVNYTVNDRVMKNNMAWISKGQGMNNDPMLRTFQYWVPYIGGQTAELYDTDEEYNVGEQIYSATGELYISIAPENQGNLQTDEDWWIRLDVRAWEQFKIYQIGDRAVADGVTYVSLTANNQDKAPASFPANWAVTGSLIFAKASYSVPTLRGQNVFRLPTGYMRMAPQDPKQGSYLNLGASTSGQYADWVFEGNYFTSSMAGPIYFRFAADLMDPDDWDPMFLDGYANRHAFEVCEVLTQSSVKKKDIGGAYNKFMSEARTVNAIEQGAVEQPEDSYIANRY